MKKSKNNNYFYIEGKHIIDEALKRNDVRWLYVTDPNFYSDYDIKKTVVNERTIKKYSDNKTNPGVIGVCYKKNVEDYDYSNFKKIIILDSVNNPINLGSIARAACAFNFDAIFLLNESVDQYNSKVIKASQGLSLTIPIIKIDNGDLKGFGDFITSKTKLYSFVCDKNDKSLQDIKSPSSKDNKPLALLFGNEANGIGEETLKLLSKNNTRIYIEIDKDVNSLNLSSSVNIGAFYFSNIIK